MENNNNIVVVGDGYVGKTSILNAIKDNNFEEQIPNVYNDFEYTEVVNGKECRLRFIDTAGQEEYDMLRKLSYREANVFLLCFAVDDKVSFENMETKWVLDIKGYNNVPIILVGTKSDLRKSNNSEFITKEEAVKFQKKVGALCYIECSAKNRSGLDDLKKRIFKALLNSKEKSCIIQ